MSSKDNIKVYLFYLNEDKSLYAFTSNKEYKNKFSYQRNKKCFNIRYMACSSSQIVSKWLFLPKTKIKHKIKCAYAGLFKI